MCDPNINSLLNGLEKAVKLIKKNNLENKMPKLLNHNWDVVFNKCYELLSNTCTLL